MKEPLKSFTSSPKGQWKGIFFKVYVEEKGIIKEWYVENYEEVKVGQPICKINYDPIDPDPWNLRDFLSPAEGILFIMAVEGSPVIPEKEEGSPIAIIMRESIPI